MLVHGVYMWGLALLDFLNRMNNIENTIVDSVVFESITINGRVDGRKVEECRIFDNSN